MMNRKGKMFIFKKLNLLMKISEITYRNYKQK